MSNIRDRIQEAKDYIEGEISYIDIEMLDRLTADEMYDMQAVFDSVKTEAGAISREIEEEMTKREQRNEKRRA